MKIHETSGLTRIDSELLLAAVLNVPRSYLYAHPNPELNLEQRNKLENFYKRRRQGEPIAYILGRKAFWTFDLEVNSATLIPRPATELLVELSLDYLAADKPCQVIDLGTGSGAIALALAQERPHWQLIASDYYPETLATAKRNAERYQLTQITFLLSDWYKQLPAVQVDAIVSNPPYVREDASELGQSDIRFEPRHALVAGSDGLSALRNIINSSRAFLKPGGYLLLEHGCDQGEQVKALMQRAGFTRIIQGLDLEGHERVVVGVSQDTAKLGC